MGNETQNTPLPVPMVEREPVYSPTDPVRVDMDERIADAINNIATSLPADWALMAHYIALKLIKTRDVLEITDSKRMGGYAQGLRFLFELHPRALSVLGKEPFKRKKEIVGEEAYITDPLENQ